ncbi:hypothetical protein BN1723_006508 [Verticillium longisporum]|uniref:Uncharacterized protein n=1 Tax=Verticillium longisporum TaxID=100787 RepID=A0A0G4NFD0_VERLO|nr:hypothetical protein BN1723_006508 [Verticillium longisporum]
MISKWLLPRSPPVLVDWTTIFLPATGPVVNKGNPRVAGTAPAGLGTTVDGRGGETEGDVIVDGKG